VPAIAYRALAFSPQARRFARPAFRRRSAKPFIYLASSASRRAALGRLPAANLRFAMPHCAGHLVAATFAPLCLAIQAAGAPPHSRRRPLKSYFIFHLPTAFLELCIDFLGLGVLPYDARILEPVQPVDAPVVAALDCLQEDGDLLRVHALGQVFGRQLDLYIIVGDICPLAEKLQGLGHALRDGHGDSPDGRVGAGTAYHEGLRSFLGFLVGVDEACAELDHPCFFLLRCLFQCFEASPCEFEVLGLGVGHVGPDAFGGTKFDRFSFLEVEACKDRCGKA